MKKTHFDKSFILNIAKGFLDHSQVVFKHFQVNFVKNNGGTDDQ